jgi:RNA polymerase sigma-70 factor (ECF subfamily)
MDSETWMPPTPTADDIVLIRRIEQRDESALSELYQQYGGLVYSIAYRVLQNSGLAEEVTQDTFLKVWNQIHTWDAQRGKLTTWLLTITRYAAIDRLRQEQRRHTQSAISIDDLLNLIGSRDDTDWHDGDLIRSLLRQLPVEQLQVIELAYFHGLSHGDMSKKLNLPLGTVKTRVRSGILRLRTLWQQSVEQENS